MSTEKTNAGRSVKCCLENMRWPGFLELRACRVAATRSKNLKRTLFPTVDCNGYEFDEFLRAFFKAIESCRLRVDLE